MKYLLKRLLKLVPIVLGVTILSFCMVYLAPSDPATMYYHNLGVTASEETLEAYRKDKGLDQPLPVQYKNWLVGVLKGDLGRSYEDNVPVTDKISRALPYTLSITLNAMVLTLVISIPLAFYLALRPNTRLASLIYGASFLGNSIPNFILGLVLMYIFAMRLGLLPVLAGNSVKGIVLPTLALALPMTSAYVRQIASITTDELSKDYIKGLKIRGVPQARIMATTVLKNISVEVITLVGMSIGSLLGGTAVIETMFNWPGMGKMVVDAVAQRDLPLIQGIVLWMALAFVLINIIIDLSYVVLDPRIRLGGDND